MHTNELVYKSQCLIILCICKIDFFFFFWFIHCYKCGFYTVTFSVISVMVLYFSWHIHVSSYVQFWLISSLFLPCGRPDGAPTCPRGGAPRACVLLAGPRCVVRPRGGEGRRRGRGVWGTLEGGLHLGPSVPHSSPPALSSPSDFLCAPVRLLSTYPSIYLSACPPLTLPVSPPSKRQMTRQSTV